MNRETQAHFAQIPSMDISRSKFDRSFIHKTTCNTGELVPVFVDPDIVPGDTVTMRMSDLIRMTTPIVPVMDDLKADFYFFFVPNRLSWSNFKRFMGENTNAPWIQETEYFIPQLKITNDKLGSYDLSATVEKGSVLAHMGIPTNYSWKKYRETVTDPDTQESTKREIKISALPVRSYCMIWNEFFRSESLQNPVNVPTANGDNYIKNTTYTDWTSDPEAFTVSNEALGGLPCLKVCKTFDYFTSCLPRPQAGPDVTLPMNGTAPIKTAEFKLTYEDNEYTYGTNTDNLYALSDATPTTYMFDNPEATGTFKTDFSISNDSKSALGLLYADLTQATGATINQLRTAFAIQKWQEREARGGWVA